MRTVAQIYSNYKIIPRLQQHQLRVAAVADTVAAHLNISINRDAVVLACLFHDMGNIIKFMIPSPHFPDGFEPEGDEYWQEVQREYREKYGNDEHVATMAIAREIGVSEEVMTYISQIGFTQLDESVASESWERKVCAYADMRVDPDGVVSVAQRLEDGKRRYGSRPDKTMPEERRLVLTNSLEQIEQQLQAVCTIDLDSITDATIAPLLDKLSEKTI